MLTVAGAYMKNNNKNQPQTAIALVLALIPLSAGSAEAANRVAITKQANAGNTVASAVQSGKDNTIEGNITGFNNKITRDAQYGDRNHMNFQIQGDRNIASIRQGFNTSISQKSYDSKASITQIGSDNNAYIESGSIALAGGHLFNDVSINQKGLFNIGRLYLSSGSYNLLSLIQDGDHNTYAPSGTAAGVFGNNNQLRFTQYGSYNLIDPFFVKGNLNEISIYQNGTNNRYAVNAFAGGFVGNQYAIGVYQEGKDNTVTQNEFLMAPGTRGSVSIRQIGFDNDYIFGAKAGSSNIEIHGIAYGNGNIADVWVTAGTGLTFMTEQRGHFSLADINSDRSAASAVFIKQNSIFNNLTFAPSLRAYFNGVNVISSDAKIDQNGEDMNATINLTNVRLTNANPLLDPYEFSITQANAYGVGATIGVHDGLNNRVAIKQGLVGGILDGLTTSSSAFVNIGNGDNNVVDVAQGEQKKFVLLGFYGSNNTITNVMQRYGTASAQIDSLYANSRTYNISQTNQHYSDDYSSAYISDQYSSGGYVTIEQTVDSQSHVSYFGDNGVNNEAYLTQAGLAGNFTLTQSGEQNTVYAIAFGGNLALTQSGRWNRMEYGVFGTGSNSIVSQSGEGNYLFGHNESGDNFSAKITQAGRGGHINVYSTDNNLKVNIDQLGDGNYVRSSTTGGAGDSIAMGSNAGSSYNGMDVTDTFGQNNKFYAGFGASVTESASGTTITQINTANSVIYNQVTNSAYASANNKLVTHALNYAYANQVGNTLKYANNNTINTIAGNASTTLPQGLISSNSAKHSIIGSSATPATNNMILTSFHTGAALNKVTVNTLGSNNTVMTSIGNPTSPTLVANNQVTANVSGNKNTVNTNIIRGGDNIVNVTATTSGLLTATDFGNQVLIGIDGSYNKPTLALTGKNNIARVNIVGSNNAGIDGYMVKQDGTGHTATLNVTGSNTFSRITQGGGNGNTATLNVNCTGCNYHLYQNGSGLNATVTYYGNQYNQY
jgi:hypothetical protein